MLLSIDFFNDTAESAERTIRHLHSFVNNIRYGNFLRTNNSFLGRTQDTVDISLTNRRGVIETTKETKNIGHKAERMSYLTLEVSLYEHIAREEQLLLDNALTITELSIFLSREQHLTDM